MTTSPHDGHPAAREGLPTKAVLISANYRGAGDTLILLESLRQLDRFLEIDIVIIDNASADDSPARIRAAIESDRNVYLFESTTNRGYFGAAKWGIARYLDAGKPLPEWVIVCNNDILLDDRQFLQKLISYNGSAAAVVAPRIKSLRWLRDQNPFMVERPGRWRLRKMRFCNSTYYIALLHDLIFRWRQDIRTRVMQLMGKTGHSFGNSGMRSIYAPQGAFMMFSRRYFEAGGYLDDNCFLYAEEISVGEICRNLGLKVIYDPRLSVCHMESRTIQRSLNRRNYHYQKAAVGYLARKYFHDL